MEIIFNDSSGNVLAAIFRGINDLPDERIELILETSKSLAGQSESSIKVFLTSAIDKLGVSETLVKMVYHRSKHLSEKIMEIIFNDSSGNVLAALFRGINDLPDDRIELILETSKSLSVQSESSMKVLKSAIDKQGVSEILVKMVYHRSKHLSEITIKNESPYERIELILKICNLAIQSQKFLKLFKKVMAKQNISNQIFSEKLQMKFINEVLFGSSNLVGMIIEIIFKVSSGDTLATIISGFGQIPEKRAELILKTCMIYGENQRPLFLMALEKRELDAFFLNRIMKCDLHHWPSVLRYLFERLGMEMTKILLLRDEPKIVRIILKFLRGNISGGLKSTCIEFIKNVHGPHALTELLKALKSKNNRMEIVRIAILDALDKNMRTVTNTQPEIVDMVIRSIIHFVGDELVRLRRIIRSCFPRVRSVVEASVENNDDNPKIQEFARLILQEYDNSENLKT
jgi:hypothetical protein